MLTFFDPLAAIRPANRPELSVRRGRNCWRLRNEFDRLPREALKNPKEAQHPDKQRR